MHLARLASLVGDQRPWYRDVRLVDVQEKFPGVTHILGYPLSPRRYRPRTVIWGRRKMQCWAIGKIFHIQTHNHDIPAPEGVGHIWSLPGPEPYPKGCRICILIGWSSVAKDAPLVPATSLSLGNWILSHKTSCAFVARADSRCLRCKAGETSWHLDLTFAGIDKYKWIQKGLVEYLKCYDLSRTRCSS